MNEKIIEILSALSCGLALSLFCNMLPLMILILFYFEKKKEK